jgi:hypothetical protein
VVRHRITYTHRSELGEFWLSSDDAIPRFFWLARIIDQIPEAERERLWPSGYTIGASIVFPAQRVDGKMTINGARAWHPRIKDRFDLTVECIRRHYVQEPSPLSDVLARYADFFGLFGDFSSYADFFHLQDLVNEGASTLKFFAPFDDFTGSPLPATVDAYLDYSQRAAAFIHARNRRIAAYVGEHPPNMEPHGRHRGSTRWSRRLKPSDNGDNWRGCSRRAIVSVSTSARTWPASCSLRQLTGRGCCSRSGLRQAACACGCRRTPSGSSSRRSRPTRRDASSDQTGSVILTRPPPESSSRGWSASFTQRRRAMQRLRPRRPTEVRRARPVWDYAAGCISSPQRIGEAQRDLPGGAVTCRRVVLEIREATFIDQEWVGQPSFEEEPEPP